MNNQHKHAGHIIIINNHRFKANESGMWNLTDIWKTLRLPLGKRPGQWRSKSAQRLTRMQKLHSAKNSLGHDYVYADKQATLKYAGWVSEDFEDMVYAAFEAVLAMPEVATVVANKMVELGHIAEAELLERHKDDYRAAMQNLKRACSRADGMKPERTCKAVLRGVITLEQAKAQGFKGVWLDRCVAALEASKLAEGEDF